MKKHELIGQSKIVLQCNEWEAKRHALQPVENGQPWWKRAAVPLPKDHTTEDGTSDKAPRLVMKFELGTADVSMAAMETQSNSVTALAAVANQADTIAEGSTCVAPVAAQDTLQELAKHYLEALYLTRTSLAYFTKGPLSRARAALANQPDSGLQASELIAFLRDAILSASVMDKKFRDGIAGIVKELPAPGLESPEQPAKAKKKRKWKSKRDKAGFYVDEKQCIEKWWHADDEASGGMSSAETADVGLKRRIPRLRSRETYLQLVLALEVLALEASLPLQLEQKLHEKDPAVAQNLETQGQDSSVPPDSRKTKAKKSQDLPALLDTLVDRLCIWHSLDSSSPAKKDNTDETDPTDGGNDELKSFCIGVIIPFYMSRIPQHAAAVNKKLGGPSAPTPVKRKTASARKPGEPATRQAPDRKPRKPLSRVSSDALKHATRPTPSLHRSATDSEVLLPYIKREGSEVPTSLDFIPPAKPPAQSRKRTSLMHSISFSKREVDLSAMSQANEAKMRKKAEVEEKLREAITTLKKPNRALAVKEAAESADMSFAKATMPKSRPSGQAQRNKPSAAGQGVHVTATPKHGRTVRATPAHKTGGSTGTTHVSSSSTRILAQRPYDVPPSTFEVPQTDHRPRHGAASVQETPSRGFARFMPAGLARQPGTLESPLTARHAQVIQQQQPEEEEQDHFGPTGIAESPTLCRQASTNQHTPLKPVRSLSLIRPDAGALIAAPPNVVRAQSPHALEQGAGREKSRSIYDSLGWDDGYEDLA